MLNQWQREDPRRKSLIARRCRTADQVARWVREIHDGQCGPNGQNGHNEKVSTESTESTAYIRSTYPEIAANAALALIAVACSLLDRQIAAQAEAFENEGGFTERLYRVRTNKRKR